MMIALRPRKAEDLFIEDCYFAKHLVIIAFGIQLASSALKQVEQS